jgi:hypothetical protein
MNDFDRVLSAGSLKPRQAKRLPVALQPAVNPTSEIEEDGRQSDDEDSQKEESEIDDLSTILTEVEAYRAKPSTAQFVLTMSRR